MSKVQLQGNVSGTGIFTIASPNSNTDRTLSLPDNTGTLITQNSQPAFASTIGVGGATPANTGAGITFPAAQSASSDANTLDDYEEGTWTPTIIFGGSSTGITYSSQIGRYTKIGNMVSVFASVQLTSKGSASGQLQMTNFPFSCINTGNPVSAIYGQLTGISSQLIPYITGTTVTVEQINTGSQSSVNQTQVNNNSAFYFSMTYQTS